MSDESVREYSLLPRRIDWRPPTADEISRYDWHEKQRQAAKAIVKAIAPDPDSPAVPF